MLVDDMTDIWISANHKIQFSRFKNFVNSVRCQLNI